MTQETLLIEHALHTWNPLYIHAWFGENTFTLGQILYRPGKWTENSARYKKEIRWTLWENCKLTLDYTWEGGRAQLHHLSQRVKRHNFSFLVLSKSVSHPLIQLLQTEPIGIYFITRKYTIEQNCTKWNERNIKN